MYGRPVSRSSRRLGASAGRLADIEVLNLNPAVRRAKAPDCCNTHTLRS